MCFILRESPFIFHFTVLHFYNCNLNFQDLPVSAPPLCSPFFPRTLRRPRSRVPGVIPVDGSLRIRCVLENLLALPPFACGCLVSVSVLVQAVAPISGCHCWRHWEWVCKILGMGSYSKCLISVLAYSVSSVTPVVTRILRLHVHCNTVLVSPGMWTSAERHHPCFLVVFLLVCP